MTLPLNFIIADDIAWIAVLGLLAIYIYRSAKSSGQYNYKCPICNLDVRKIKQNNDRYFRLTAHDRFTWRNPLAFYQTFYFCSFEHISEWLGETVNQRIDRVQKEIDILGSKPIIHIGEEIPSDEELERRLNESDN